MNPAARLAGTPWMIREDALRSLAPRAAVAAEADRRPYRAQGGVALIDLFGPIYRHSSPLDDFLAELFGGVSIDALRAALRAATADPQVQAVVLNVDSPGGEAAGVGELAAEVRQAAAGKPVVAFAEAQACSAAYYIAAAAGEVVVGPAAVLGSIGVLALLVDDSGFQEKVGIKDVPIVSSQSPDKWVDAATPAGRDLVQSLVDSIAKVMIADIARYRATTAARVAADFGRGGLLVGADAVRAGMADRVGTLDEVVRKLSGPNRARLAAARPAATVRTASPGPAGRYVLRLRPASPGRA